MPFLESDAERIDRVRTAIRDLTDVEALDLERFAHWQLSSLAGVADGHGRDDLLQEAITATLAGDRKWSSDKTFCEHLKLAMRSISRNWRKAGRREHRDPGIAKVEAESRVAGVPFEAERAVAWAEVYSRLQAAIRGDGLLERVVACELQGLTDTETAIVLRVEHAEIRAAKKRILRRLRKHRRSDHV